MTTQFSDKFDALYSKENNPRIGEVQCLPSSGEHSPQGILGGTVEARSDWLGGRDIPLRLAGPIF